MAKKAKKKAKKGAAKKSLKLRKKALRDLPTRTKATKVTGGTTLTPSQLAAAQSQATRTFAPPYVPVQPSLQTPRQP